MNNINTAKSALCNNSFAYNRILGIAYNTSARKLSCRWREMKYDYENHKDAFVIMFNFLKAFINGEFRFQFKGRGKNYLFAEMPAQCKNNLKALCGFYDVFLSIVTK